jgi:hypothetical protein
MSRQKENVIREKRTNLAIKNNLMGPAGKLGVILQAFGTPITRQGSSLMDQSFIEDAYGDFVQTEYSSTLSGQQGPIASRDEILDSYDDYFHNEGLLFDGLSRGMHLEIVYWNVENKLKVSYKGYPVYLEVTGELDCYAPADEWEALIDKLYKASKDRIKQMKKQEKAEIAEKIEQKKSEFWQQIKTRWGIS